MPRASLTTTLQTALRTGAPRTLCVAFSGGPDSTALLHALAQLPEARGRGLRALHVDHGLHHDSARWAQRCTGFCESAGVPLTVIAVRVDDTRGEGIEAAARRARYAAFAQQLGAGEWLALAHHRDDQIETVLLKLLRGAGPEGLGGMRTLRPFAAGFLWRPLLDVPRAALRAYVEQEGLACIDDPANADPRFARNVLRHDLLPLIARHWPAADVSILHAARACRAAADYVARAADSALAALADAEGTLDLPGWMALPAAVHAAVLDAWLHRRGLAAPPDAARSELERQIASAAGDRVPMVTWPDTEVRVWTQRLYATPRLAVVPTVWSAAWHGEDLALPPDCGSLALEQASPDAADTRFAPPLTVRLRRGGERMQPAGDAHVRDVQALFQRAGMPPWLRARCPLIFEGDTLVAVADLCASARGNALFAKPGRPRWRRPEWA
ncbi:MAG TPA: tRNA lysidine(34) synthetase TilS [Rhodanobacteraceae bacterium]